VLFGCWGVLALLLCPLPAYALGGAPWIATAPSSADFTLVHDGRATALWADTGEETGVLRAVGDLQADIARVSGVRPALAHGETAPSQAIIIGTLGRSRLIDALARDGKIEAVKITGRWEAFLVQVVEAPFPGVDRALVIAGSDKRGTIYGIYELSEQIGVSPWYWWADVPVTHRAELSIRPVHEVDGGPAVKYRGIFLNDEAPALAGWAREKFGGFNHQFYEKLFELLLRLRANYLWPAMWGNAFNEDDPLNPKLANDYGIVMGTSHHEPMVRAQQEWKRHGRGAWNYQTNGAELREFWSDGIRRNRDYESIVTLGMRGDGDMPMSEESNVALLEKIVSDQRAILAREMNPDVTKIPQLWALYKEVQDYYEKGMRVPDDVTLLWCDDNWGNIRRLPTPAERARSGGAGIYYHFDYVGGPRNYKWLNTVPITKVWEQMHLAWQYDATRIWIVNVGDLKPMEFPTEFFLRYAWAPQDWPHERLAEYGRLWAAREFGAEHADEIAGMIAEYTKFNGRRKPEQLEPDTFSLIHYGEAEKIVADWKDLTARAERLHFVLPAEARDAFYQLVLWPIKASAIVNELNVTVGYNRLYARQGRASTNPLAERARALFADDAALTRFWNETFAGGKWRHFADQTHLGYTYWQQPVANAMPAVTAVQVKAGAEMGVAVEGSANAWPGYDPGGGAPVLPALNVYDQAPHFFEVFNRGETAFAFSAEASEPWLHVSPAQGTVGDDVHVTVSADWSRVPVGEHRAAITVRGPAGSSPVIVQVPVFNPAAPRAADFTGFVETRGGVSIEAAHYGRAVASEGITWQTLADFGRTLSGVTPFPVTVESRTLSADSPRLEYPVYLFSTGEIAVRLIVAPTLNFTPGRGLRCAVSFDDGPPQTIDLLADRSLPAWERSVSDGVRQVAVRQRIDRAGAHVLKIWMVDPGVVLEKIVIDAGGVKPSYLGPPESPRLTR
jgi:hypothetical protein